MVSSIKLRPWTLRALLALPVGLALGAAWSCAVPSGFICTADAQCGEGECVGGGCAFPDDDCETGLRYGALALEHLAGECVEPEDFAEGSESDSASMGSGDGDGDATGDGDGEPTDSGNGDGDGDSTSASDSDDPCAGDETGPMIISAVVEQLAPGTTDVIYELRFDEPVLLSPDSLGFADLGPVIDAVEPQLPAMADTFFVTISQLVDYHELLIDPAQISDACGNPLGPETSVWLCSGHEVFYEFSGQPIEFAVTACVDGAMTIEAWGAQGGDAVGGAVGGRGGYATGKLEVDNGDVLTLRVGGRDGFNGGGLRGSGPGSNGGSGGGATDVRLGPDTLDARVIVAGGGGGGGGNGPGPCGGPGGAGGPGGGYEGGPGGDGAFCVAYMATGGGGASQNAGGGGGVSFQSCGVDPQHGGVGALGAGGAGGGSVTGCDGDAGSGAGGGGGGGYYGGGGGAGGAAGEDTAWSGAAGGGGSSWVAGVDDGNTSESVRSGNGQLRLSW